MEAEEHLAEMTLPSPQTVKPAKRKGSEMTCSLLPTECHLNQEGYRTSDVADW
jgi:hypothetical protein